MLIKKTRGFLKEFQSFAIKGNALELAIGVVVGAAFGRIVSSLVADVITPSIAFLTGGADFKHLSVTLREGTEGTTPAVVTYGAFLQTMFDFFFIALSIFLVFKLISAARKRLFVEEEKQVVAPHEKPAQERLLEEIRDLLKERK